MIALVGGIMFLIFMLGLLARVLSGLLGTTPGEAYTETLALISGVLGAFGGYVYGKKVK